MSNFLDSQFPLIQAPMAGVQGSRLAIATCLAGAVGSLPCAMLSIEAANVEFENIRAATSRPFNANFFCHSELPSSPEINSTWRELLSPYYAELGVEYSAAEHAGRRLPFNSDMASLVEKFRPEIVSFHFGLPSPELLLRVRNTGAKVISTATTVPEALWLERHGVDAVIAQGWEAGGHRGSFLDSNQGDPLGVMALVPQLVDALSIPVIAAGAIVDSRSVRAAFALGASAVQVGTAFLLCHEASTSAVHKHAIKTRRSSESVVTNVFSGRPARGLVNRLIREIGPINLSAPPFPQASIELSPLRQAAERIGLDDYSPLWVGQNFQKCKEQSAAEIVNSLMADF